MVEESYYGEDGRVEEKKSYNEEGDLISKMYVGDKEQDPSEEFNPAPTMAGETLIYKK